MEVLFFCIGSVCFPNKGWHIRITKEVFLLLEELIPLFSSSMDWNLFPKQIIMWVIGGLLIYLAIKKDMEPALLLPMGFGAILAVSYTHLGHRRRYGVFLYR